jgi:hypothetical protein
MAAVRVLAAGAAALTLIFAGMVVSKIATHFELIESKDNGSKIYKCLSCLKVITCTGDKKLKAHVAGKEGEGVTCCPTPNPAMREWYKKELSEGSPTKRPSSTAEGSSVGSPPKPGSIAHSFGAASKVEADQSIVSWLAWAKLPPYITASPYFKSMLRQTAEAGPSYVPPNTHAMGMDRGKLGHVLQVALDRVREKAAVGMQALKFIKVKHLFPYVNRNMQLTYLNAIN